MLLELYVINSFVEVRSVRGILAETRAAQVVLGSDVMVSASGVGGPSSSRCAPSAQVLEGDPEWLA